MSIHTQRGSSKVVVLILLLVIVVGGGYYVYQKNTESESGSEESSGQEGDAGVDQPSGTDQSPDLSQFGTLNGLGYEAAAKKAEEIALFLVEKNSLGIPDCPRVSADAITSLGEGAIEKSWSLYVTYTGCRDDSIEAIREERMLTRSGSGWTLAEAHFTSNRCAAGRGHQDFSEEPCL